MIKIVILMLFLTSSPVLAHSWFEKWCCSDRDCKPTPCEEIVETEKGWKWKEYIFKKVMPSQDNKCYTCITDYSKEPRCAYIQFNT